MLRCFAIVVTQLAAETFATLEATLGSTDVNTWLSESAALVLHSSYGEALPMAGIEALALGIPVITTDVGDCRSLCVYDWQCVRRGDSIGLARSMRTLSELPKQDMLELRRASYALARERFDITQTVSKYADLYVTVCK